MREETTAEAEKPEIDRDNEREIIHEILRQIFAELDELTECMERELG